MTLATFDQALLRAKKSLLALDLTTDQMQAVMNVMTDMVAVACEELVRASRDAVDAARAAERTKRDDSVACRNCGASLEECPDEPDQCCANCFHAWKG